MENPRAVKIVLMLILVTRECALGSPMVDDGKENALSENATEGPPGNPGHCTKMPLARNFNMNEFLGRWYVIEQFNSPFAGDCATVDYFIHENCSIGVMSAYVDDAGEKQEASYSAYTAGDPTIASLTMIIPGYGTPFDGSLEGNLNVLGTDYLNFAVTYSCIIDLNHNIPIEWSMVLTREPTLGGVFKGRLHEWLARLGVSIARYETSEHRRCTYPNV